MTDPVFPSRRSSVPLAHPHLVTLTHTDDFERLVQQSHERPVLVFKHSYSCGVSHEALEELVAHLDEQVADVSYAMVTVQTHRDVSNAIAATLGVRHQTPQAILVREGRAVWSASHFRITSDQLRQALAAPIAEPPPTR